MASVLTRLEYFHIAGCPKVTHAGISSVLSGNSAGIIDLALEGVSPSFVCICFIFNYLHFYLQELIQDMKEFRKYCFRTHALERLQSITLTFPLHGVTTDWLQDVQELLWNSPLTKFHLYTTGGQAGAPLSLDELFIERFVRKHSSHLTRLAILRLPISVRSLSRVCTTTTLEQLFLSVRKADLVSEPWYCKMSF